MTTNQQEKPPKEPEKREGPGLDAAISKHVMHTLGQPGDLYKLQVRRLWQDRYRVNVLTGPDASSIKIAHSYYLVVDAEGGIVASTPAITKQY